MVLRIKVKEKYYNNLILLFGLLFVSSSSYAGHIIQNSAKLDALLASFPQNDWVIKNQNKNQIEETVNEKVEQQPKTYKIAVEDKYNLLNQKEIAFKDRDGLKQGLNDLLAKLLDKGYVTSSIVSDGGKIKVIEGMVDKVIMKDSSTFFPNIKKKLFDINLEGKILNLADINRFVEKYNQNTTNKLNVSVDNSDKPHYSNIVLKNDYHFKVTPRAEVKYYILKEKEKNTYKLNYNLGLDFEQILGFNDRLSLNGMFMKLDQVASLNYSLLAKNTTIGLNYLYYKNKDEFYKTSKLYSLGLSASTPLVSEPDFMVSNVVSISQEKEVEKIKNTEFVNRSYTGLGTIFSFRKYVLKEKDIYSFGFIPTIDIKLARNKSKNDKNLCLMLHSNADFSYKYYTLDAFLGYSKLVSGDVLYDKCKYTNNLTDFDNAPLTYKDAEFVSYINNTMKYPITIKNFTLAPFVEMAFGRDFKNKETLIGGGVGAVVSGSYIGLGTKYSRTKNESSITMKLNIQY